MSLRTMADVDDPDSSTGASLAQAIIRLGASAATSTPIDRSPFLSHRLITFDLSMHRAVRESSHHLASRTRPEKSGESESRPRRGWTTRALALVTSVSGRNVHATQSWVSPSSDVIMIGWTIEDATVPTT